jgi:hypothetical protein
VGAFLYCVKSGYFDSWMGRCRIHRLKTKLLHQDYLIRSAVVYPLGIQPLKSGTSKTERNVGSLRISPILQFPA